MNIKKQPKSKKTAGEKRIIANYIIAYMFAGMAISAMPAVSTSTAYQYDMNALDKKQNAIYEEYMEGPEFSNATNAQLMQLSEDYSYGTIDYTTFRKRLNAIFTVENAKEVLANSNNTEVKAQIEEINQQKQKRTEELDSNIVPEISCGAVTACGAGILGSCIASMIYAGKEAAEEKRKKKQIVNAIKDQPDATIPNVPRHVDACIIKTEEEEKRNTL